MAALGITTESMNAIRAKDELRAKQKVADALLLRGFLGLRLNARELHGAIQIEITKRGLITPNVKLFLRSDKVILNDAPHLSQAISVSGPMVKLCWEAMINQAGAPKSVQNVYRFMDELGDHINLHQGDYKVEQINQCYLLLSFHKSLDYTTLNLGTKIVV